jgi:type IV pilus assembly protein PilY1
MAMKHSFSVRSLLYTLGLASALGLPPTLATAANTDIAQIPLGTASSLTVLPNLMFILDDSGSMGFNYMPDNVEDTANACKTYARLSNGTTSTNCAAVSVFSGTPFPDTDLVSTAGDSVRHVDIGGIGAVPWMVGPPGFAAEFNTIYYNPKLTYRPGLDAAGASLGSFGSPWTAVKINPYLSALTFNLTTEYPEPVFCINANDTPTNNTNCRRNGFNATGTTPLASFRYSNASTPGNGSFGWPESTASGQPRFLRMRFGGPYYYTITPREHCSDVNLTTCTLSATPTGAFTLPAPVRYCTTSALANQTAVVTGGSPASCQAKLDSTHQSVRYGDFARTDIVSTVTTYGNRPNRTDCAAAPNCTYTEEMTNFANWYAYYHTRMQTMKSSAGRVFSTLDDRYRIGFLTINASSSAKYLKIDKYESTHKANWYTKLYAQVPASGTPLRQALSRAGRHFAGKTDGINSFMPDDPVQYSCQQNFALLTTDGYWNGAGGIKLDGTTAMDNQDNVADTVAPIFVSRPTATLDGAGTVVTTTTGTTALEQVVCTGNTGGSANFTGTPDGTCGCLTPGFKRVKQRSLTTSDTVVSTDGVDAPPTTTTNATFQDITAVCNALQITRTIVTRETKRVVCGGGGNANFGDAFGTQACGCGGTNKRVKQRVHDITRVIVTTDGVTTSDTTNHGAGAFSNFAGAPPNGTAGGACVGSATLGAPGAVLFNQTVAVSDNNPGTSNGGTTITSANFTITPNPTTVTNVPTSTTTPGGFADTLADVAMYYYKNDLRGSGWPVSIEKNNVPTTPKDTASHQHMVTFTLGLGLDGLMNYKSDYETATVGDFHNIKTGATGCSFTTGTCNWPQPLADAPSALDDLWHAAVNGRGIYFSAKDPNSLQSGLTTALSSIKITIGAAASSATSTPNITPTDNFIYSSTYRTVKWDGEIVAERIDVVTGAILPGIAWSASTKLDARVLPTSDTRNIFTFDGGVSRKLKAFTYAGLTGSEPSYFDNKCTTDAATWPQCGPMVGSPGDLAIANSGTNLVNWLRGQKQHETTYFRAREHALGDTVNAKPSFVGKPNLQYGDPVSPDYNSFKSGPAATRTPILYISGNDGMLHAFDGSDTSSGGEEVWAYVPRMLMPQLFKLAASNYDVNHRYYVDGSPTTMDVFIGGAWKTILVGGLNAGGRGFYALDITDSSSTGVKGLWEICSDATLCAISDADLGFSFGQPIITKRPSDGKWVVIVTSGYNNVSPGDGGGHLYVLDAATGAVLSKTGTTIVGVNVGTVAAPSGFAKIAGFATNFTVNNTTTHVYGGDLLGNVWRFDMGTSAAAPDVVTVMRIGETLDGSTPPKPQSITTKPEITRFDAGFNVIYVGTGRYLGSTDIQDPATLVPPANLAYQQSIYGFKDTGTDLGSLRAPAAKLQVQTMSLIDAVSRTISNNAVDWSTQNGWYVDFNPANDSPGERVNIDMQLVKGVLIIATNEPNTEACSTGGNSFIYFFDYQSGSYVASSPGGVVGTRMSSALAAGFVVYRLPNGQLKFAEINVNSTKKVGGVPPGSAASLGKRISWRELML